MFYSPSSLLLQTNLDRAHSCQPQLHLPLSPYTRKNLQNKTEFTSKPAPCRRHFSTHLRRKDLLSFFGNTWALTLSKAFNTPFMQSFPSPLCNTFHTLSAHLSRERQLRNPCAGTTPLPVFVQNNSTLHRDVNSDPRIDSAEFTLPGLHYEHSSSLARLYCSGSMSQNAQSLFWALSWSPSAVQPLYSSTRTEQNSVSRS